MHSCASWCPWRRRPISWREMAGVSSAFKRADLHRSACVWRTVASHPVPQVASTSAGGRSMRCRDKVGRTNVMAISKPRMYAFHYCIWSFLRPRDQLAHRTAAPAEPIVGLSHEQQHWPLCAEQIDLLWLRAGNAPFIIIACSPCGPWRQNFRLEHQGSRKDSSRIDDCKLFLLEFSFLQV